MIKAALIDMDGVLYDSMPLHAAAWKRLTGEMGICLDEEEFYLYEGMTGEATINLIAGRELGRCFSKDEAKELYGKKSAYFVELGKPAKMKGAEETLRFLKDKGIICVLVTGSGQTSLLDRLSHDYPGIFSKDRMVTAWNVSKGKPDPEPYLKGAELAEVDIKECIAIDNAPLGVMSAHRSGAYTIGVTTGPIPPEELKKSGADVVVSSMEACCSFLKENLSKI